jgi:hypothetical protein
MDVKQEIEAGDGVTHVHLELSLTKAEHDAVLLLLGLGLVAIRRRGMTEIAYELLRAVNKANAGNPDWHPYWTPEAKP